MSVLIDCLLQLLYPLITNTYTLIPNIKPDFIEYLDAPVPYIIGMSKKVWDLKCTKRKIKVLDQDPSVIAYYIEKDFFLVGKS